MRPALLERAQDYLRMSKDYETAASELLKRGAYEGRPLPFFMLIAHALELSLKAVLSAAGTDEERLIGIGHDLEGCFRMVRRTGLYPTGASSGVVNLVEALAMPHAFQAFRYPQPFGWTLPEPREAIGALHRHLDIVAEAVAGDAAVETMLQASRDRDRGFDRAAGGQMA